MVVPINSTRAAWRSSRSVAKGLRCGGGAMASASAGEFRRENRGMVGRLKEGSRAMGVTPGNIGVMYRAWRGDHGAIESKRQEA